MFHGDYGECYGCLGIVPNVVRMSVVMNVTLEVLENVVEHLLVLGVDSEAVDGRSAAVADGAALHDERVGDGGDHTQRAAAARRRPGHRVPGPQHSRELDFVATNVTDRLRQQTHIHQTSLAAAATAATNAGTSSSSYTRTVLIAFHSFMSQTAPVRILHCE